MKNLVIGIIADREHANMAVDELNNKNYTKEISTIVKEDIGSEIKTTQDKQEVKEGTTSGAVAGGILGALVGLLATATTVAVPGLGTVLVTGPLLTLLGATGGAITGGIVGALVDMGVPEEKAKLFQDYISRGEILIAVTAEEDREEEVSTILQNHGARDVFTAMVEE